VTTRLLVLHPESDERVRLVDGDLPIVDDPFTAGVTVVRTLVRDGDDTVVLCEARDDGGPWGAHDLLALVDDGAPRERWQERGWLDDALRWIDEVHGVRGEPQQLRHWGLSAVVRVGDVVLKEVPAAMADEGRITADLGRHLPDAVPTVLAVEGNRYLMKAFTAEDRSVEPDGLLALGELQRAVLDGVDAPDRRLEHLAEDARARLTTDVLREDRYELASTDTRRPPRAVTDGDLEQLDAVLDHLPADVERLPVLPATIVHGDLHVRNVAWVRDRCLLFDWGQASISHPFMDLLMWSQWAESGERAFAPYFAAWGVDVDWRSHHRIAQLFLAVTCARLAQHMTDPRHAYDWAAGAQRSTLRALATAS
jgi:hypothetical protein